MGCTKSKTTAVLSRLTIQSTPDTLYNPYNLGPPLFCDIPEIRMTRSTVAKYNTNTTQMKQSPRGGQTLKPGAYWVNFSWESPEGENGGLQTQQSHSFSPEATTVSQWLTAGMECKMFKQAQEGEDQDH